MREGEVCVGGWWVRGVWEGEQCVGGWRVGCVWVGGGWRVGSVIRVYNHRYGSVSIGHLRLVLFLGPIMYL